VPQIEAATNVGDALKALLIGLPVGRLFGSAVYTAQKRKTRHSAGLQ